MLQELFSLLFTVPFLVPVAFFFAGCACCSGVACNICSDSYAGSYQVVISGLSNGSCSGCADVDGTYVLTSDIKSPQCAPFEANGTTPCMHTYSGDPSPCGGDAIAKISIGLRVFRYNLTLTPYVTGSPVFNDYYINAQLSSCATLCSAFNSGFSRWGKHLGSTAPACGSMSESLTFFENTNDCGTGLPSPTCDGSTATVVVSAV